MAATAGQVLGVLDADAVRKWLSVAASSVDAHRALINELNVFPVADADTGTNLTVTLRSAADAARREPAADAEAVLQAAAAAAVHSAQGNSGAIIAGVLRGFCGITGADFGTGPWLCAGLTAASDAAYQVVGDPQEGTVLTAARAAAQATAGLAAGATLGELVAAAVAAAGEATRHSPELLPLLARAGVVDAGALGLVLVLDALAEVVTGSSLRPADLAARPRSRRALRGLREGGSVDFEYEVQYLLDASDPAVLTLRGYLAGLGDSLAVVGTGSGQWRVHVHVNDIGAAIEAGIGAGSVSRVSVLRFADAGAAESDDDAAGTRLLALSPGPGVGELLRAEGVLVLECSAVAQAQAAALEIASSSGATRVVLLPNTSDEVAHDSSDLVASSLRRAGVHVAVVPIRSPLQALAAVAVHDVSRRLEDDVIAMAEAAAATRFAEVRVAEREGLTSVGICHQGDVLGLIDGDVVQIGRSVGAVALAVTDRLLGTGGELITVMLGLGSTPDSGDALRRHIEHVAPLTEVVLYEAPSLTSPLLIGME